ncbi:MAG: radical SAM protein [Candidatus Aminicenantes bacterium]|nr:radical SAM protein [Candidatus Aminicenantes bacterium]
MGCEPELLKKEAMPAATRKLDLPEGVPPLTSLYMYIAGSCNLTCRHCWIEPDYQADNNNGKFLKLEHLKKAIAEAKPLGLQSVKLTGGEPMLHPQFCEIVDYIESENIGMIMETNGTLIDDKIARFLKSKPHFNFISVSVDGARAETHDKLRGVNGSFKNAVAGIKALAKAGFHPQIICTLHKGNVTELEDIIRMAVGWGCGSVKFNHIQQSGRGEVFYSDNGLTVKELILLFNKIEAKIKKKYPISIYFDIPQAFFPIKKLLNDSMNRCAIKNILGILSGGEMALCGIGVTVPELVCGNIGTDHIKNVWINHKFFMELRDQIPSSFTGICGNCIFRDSCIGSCIANNYHQSGKLTSSYFFCEESNRLGIFPQNRINK